MSPAIMRRIVGASVLDAAPPLSAAQPAANAAAEGRAP
jgi:hypothetical protein